MVDLYVDFVGVYIVLFFNQVISDLSVNVHKTIYTQNNIKIDYSSVP